MHTTRSAFKTENTNLKNAETASYSFKQFGYLSLHIRGSGALVEVFRVFSIYLKGKVPFHLYRNIGRDNDDDYNDGESSDKNDYEEHTDEKHALIR